MKIFLTIFLFLFFTIPQSIHGQGKDSLGFPELIGWVNDFEHVFTQEQVNILDSIISEHENKTTDQIVIVTLDTVFSSDEELADYSLNVVRRWGVDAKNKNNGVGIFFGTKMRMIRIQNGYGIESRLSNEETKEIIDNIIIPEFKKGDYFEGVKKGLLAIIEKIK